MPLVAIVLAFTFYVAFQGMLSVFTLVPTSFPRLAKLLCFCRCLILLCHTLVLSFLLLGVGFGLSLASFWGCLKLISRAHYLFHRIFRAIQDEIKQVFCLLFDQIAQDPMDDLAWFLFLLLLHWCLCYT